MAAPQTARTTNEFMCSCRAARQRPFASATSTLETIPPSLVGSLTCRGSRPARMLASEIRMSVVLGRALSMRRCLPWFRPRADTPAKMRANVRELPFQSPSHPQRGIADLHTRAGARIRLILTRERGNDCHTLVVHALQRLQQRTRAFRRFAALRDTRRTAAWHDVRIRDSSPSTSEIVSRVCICSAREPALPSDQPLTRRHASEKGKHTEEQATRRISPVEARSLRASTVGEHGGPAKR